jgi:hypothetical protein
MYYPVTQKERRSDWSTVWYCEISPLRTMFLFYMLDTLDRKSVRGHHYNQEPDPPVSSTNKTDRHDIAEILLNVALNTITQPHNNTLLQLYLEC